MKTRFEIDPQCPEPIEKRANPIDLKINKILNEAKKAIEAGKYDPLTQQEEKEWRRIIQDSILKQKL